MKSNRVEELSRDALAEFVAENLAHLFEEEALAALANRHVTPQICQQIARSIRLTAVYSVRLRLVAHRQTPQAHAVKLVHYLYWFDLLRLSVDVRVPPTVRRAIDQRLLTNVNKLTVGERVTSARRCNVTLAKALMFDPELSVFEALLTNSAPPQETLAHWPFPPPPPPRRRPRHAGLLAARDARAASPARRRPQALVPLRHPQGPRDEVFFAEA